MTTNIEDLLRDELVQLLRDNPKFSKLDDFEAGEIWLQAREIAEKELCR